MKEMLIFFRAFIQLLQGVVTRALGTKFRILYNLYASGACNSKTALMKRIGIRSYSSFYASWENLKRLHLVKDNDMLTITNRGRLVVLYTIFVKYPTMITGIIFMYFGLRFLLIYYKMLPLDPITLVLPFITGAIIIGLGVYAKKLFQQLEEEEKSTSKAEQYRS